VPNLSLALGEKRGLGEESRRHQRGRDEGLGLRVYLVGEQDDIEGPIAP
jgi:hypothetical protein